MRDLNLRLLSKN